MKNLIFKAILIATIVAAVRKYMQTTKKPEVKTA